MASTRLASPQLVKSDRAATRMARKSTAAIERRFSKSIAFHPWPAAFCRGRGECALAAENRGHAGDAAQCGQGLGAHEQAEGTKDHETAQPGPGDGGEKEPATVATQPFAVLVLDGEPLAFQLVARRLLVAATNTEAAPKKTSR